MTRRIALLAILCALATCAGAQTVNLTASNLKTVSNSAFTGKLCVVPANTDGAVVNFRYGSGGQGVSKQACFQVNSGVLQAGVQVPDTWLTIPKNLCLYTQMIDPTLPAQKQVVGVLPCLQPASSQQSWCTSANGVVTCNLDNYVPTQQVYSIQTAATITVGPVETSLDGLLDVKNVGSPTNAILAFTFPAVEMPGSTDAKYFDGKNFWHALFDCINQSDLYGRGDAYGITCDLRSFSQNGSVGVNANTALRCPECELLGELDINNAYGNVNVYLPCGTIRTDYPVVIGGGVRNVSFHGCGYRGGSDPDGTIGSTVWVYTGADAAFKVGDPTYAKNTKGFHMDNVNINLARAGSAAKALAFYRTQEIDLRNVTLNGNQTTGQTGLLLDGSGNYTGGTFDSNMIDGFGTALQLTGGHSSGSVTGDFANASTFTRTHIVCPTSGGAPVAGTYGVDIQAGDGNTFTGGDVESCATMFHLGANAINNTVTGLRNENSTVQYQADAGSSFNAVFSGGTLFTGKLIDNGSRNSFQDAFHRTANGVKGDWYASQVDDTIVNHLRLGIGSGTVRGLQWESQVDQGTSGSVYNWLWGLTDGAAGASNWIYQDLINNAVRLQLGQLNTAGGNNQTALNAAGSGNVCFNCSANSGSGGVAFASGGSTPSTVATLDGSGNLTLNGYHRFFSGSTEGWRLNCASTSACNFDSMSSGSSAHHLRLYNGAGTDIDSEGSSSVTVNAGTNSGVGGFYVYSGGASPTRWFSVGASGYTVVSALAGAGHRCVYADASGGLNASATDCGSGSGSGSGSVTSVALSMPADFTVSGSPVTTSGALSAAWAVENPNAFLAGPASGSTAAAPTWRALVAADLPASITSSTSGNAATATKLASNTLGCLSGWDYYGCPVYAQSAVSESAATGAYATVWTAPAAGVYRVTGYLYGTSASTTSCSVTQYVKAANSGQSAGNGYAVQTAQIGASISSGNGYPVLFNLAAGAAVQVESLVSSGSCTGGAWTRAILIERLQ